MGNSGRRRIITVFGASGFIGRHVVRNLAKQGWVIRAVCRDPEAAHFLRPMGAVGQIIPWGADITDRQSVEIALDGTEAAVNLVGILYESGKATFDRIHVEAAKTIAEVAAEKDLKRLVHVSALGADANSDAAYARSKAAGEAAVQSAFPNASILRPSVIFGPEDNFFNLFAGISQVSPFLPVIGAPAFPKVRLGGGNGFGIDVLGDGGPKFQPVYVSDVAKATVACIDTPEAMGKTYDLAGPRIYSFADVMRLVLQITGRKRLLMPVPFWLAKFEGFFLEKLPKPLLTVDQVRLMHSDNVASGGNPGLNDLGISATAAEAVLPTYLRRFRTPSGQARIVGG